MRCLGLALVLVTALASPTFAQTKTPTTTSTTTETYVTAKPTDVLARNLIGLSVTNPNREAIGEIQDVLISSDGRLAGYIVSVGGFLGLGEHYVVVLPSSVRINYSENDGKWSAGMEATKDDLKAASAFKYEGRWAK